MSKYQNIKIYLNIFIFAAVIHVKPNSPTTYERHNLLLPKRYNIHDKWVGFQRQRRGCYFNMEKI